MEAHPIPISPGQKVTSFLGKEKLFSGVKLPQDPFPQKSNYPTWVTCSPSKNCYSTDFAKTFKVKIALKKFFNVGGRNGPCWDVRGMSGFGGNFKQSVPKKGIDKKL